MRSRIVEICLLVGVLACRAQSAQRTAAAVIRDSLGIAIVENAEPLDGTTPRYRIDSVPLVDIGGSEDPHVEFTEAIHLARLSDGRIIVAAGHSRELRWFSSGKWIRSAGRNGSGPGEFRQLDLLAVNHDTVLVYDFALRRLSVFDSAGKYVRRTTILASDTVGTSYPVAVFGDGRLLLATNPEPAPNRAGVRRDSVAIRVGSADGTLESMVGWFPDLDQLFTVDSRGVGQMRVMFGRQSRWCVLDSMVVIATADRFGFDLYTANGRLLRRIRRRYTPVAVTQADVNKQIEVWLSSFFPAGMEAKKRQARASFEAGPRRETKPPYDLVLVSEAGEVWIREYSEPYARERPGTYSVFDWSGQWLAQVVMPAGVEPKWIGAEELLATWRDEEDVTRVRSYRMTVGR